MAPPNIATHAPALDTASSHRSENAKLYTAADRWTKQLDRITTSVTNRVA